MLKENYKNEINGLLRSESFRLQEDIMSDVIIVIIVVVVANHNNINY